jgi:hypothetical protein
MFSHSLSILIPRRVITHFPVLLGFHRGQYFAFVPCSWGETEVSRTILCLYLEAGVKLRCRGQYFALYLVAGVKLRCRGQYFAFVPCSWREAEVSLMVEVRISGQVDLFCQGVLKT